VKCFLPFFITSVDT